MVVEKVPLSRRGPRPKILLVDDEEFFLDLVREILEEAGYEVTALANSALALNLFSVTPSEFDLVVVDEKMPGLTGTDLCEQMLEIRPDIRVILHTDYLNPASAKRARAAGVKAVVGKSYRMSPLITRIRRLLES
jgi:CheY-like chemotaxis protein